MIVDWIFNSIMFILIKFRIAESSIISLADGRKPFVVYSRRKKGVFR